jgi:hypothetical protein
VPWAIFAADPPAALASGELPIKEPPRGRRLA